VFVAKHFFVTLDSNIVTSNKASEPLSKQRKNNVGTWRYGCEAGRWGRI
jgi:hypothetical protein